MARRFADTGHSVHVYEEKPFVGGHVHDALEGDTLVSSYGPHIFHAEKDSDVLSFALRFASFRGIRHRVQSWTKRGWVPWPVNEDTLEAAYGVYPRNQLLAIHEEEVKRAHKAMQDQPASFESMMIAQMGVPLYELTVAGYTEKQWRMPANQVPATVAGRVRMNKGKNRAFFPSKEFVGLPIGGYTKWVENMLQDERISISLGEPVQAHNLRALARTYDRVVSTAPVDIISGVGRQLRYLSLKFVRDESTPKNGWPTPVVNFAARDVPYTRGTKYHLLWGTKTKVTVLELPDDGGEPLYPVRTKDNDELSTSLRARLHTAGVVSAGRLGGYSYLDMKDAIKRGIELADAIVEEA